VRGIARRGWGCRRVQRPSRSAALQWPLVRRATLLLTLSALAAIAGEDLDRARSLERQGRWREAAEAYAKDGSDPMALGYALFRSGRHDEAAKAYATALAAPVERQSEILYSIAAYNEFRRGDRKAAAHLCQLGTERFPESPFPWSSLGWYLGLEGQDAKAREAYRKAAALAAVATEPRHGTKLSLPFRGRCRVLQGNGGTHSHLSLRNRFAWDFQAIDEKGRAFRGKGTRNEDYVGFGLPILAPADGVVVDAHDGVDDNDPGKTDPVLSEGNFVYVEHAPGEVSRVFHLKKGSILVRPGQHVSRGDVLGLCGNSGYSTEPHVCFCLARARPPFDVSIAARFTDYTRIRRWEPSHVSEGVPDEDQWVESGRD